jgi:dTDP-4-amino-4,6-dideoxygalactose transaminase
MTVPMVHWSAKNSPSRPTLIKVDVDDTLCADITKIDEAIELAKLNGSDLSDVAVCYVMTAGLVSPGLAAAAVRWRSLGVKVVLDMSHAHGATYNGYAPYTWADAATWSFYATKVLTSGEGGIAWFSDPQHAEDAKIVANQGKKRGTGKFMVEGRGYRLSEFAAAVMAYEVTMARTVYQKRQSVAKSYEGFGIPGLHQFVPQLQTSFYKYVVPVSATKFAPDSADAVEEAFASLGVRCTGRVHGFSENGGRPWSMPRAKFWAQNHVCLPVGRLMHPMMLETIEEAWKQIRK